jgi:hypothetical protein
MRAANVRRLLIYCSDYHCWHWTAISGDRWPDDVRLSDLEPRFTCQARGRRERRLLRNFRYCHLIGNHRLGACDPLCRSHYIGGGWLDGFRHGNTDPLFGSGDNVNRRASVCADAAYATVCLSDDADFTLRVCYPCLESLFP